MVFNISLHKKWEIFFVWRRFFWSSQVQHVFFSKFNQNVWTNIPCRFLKILQHITIKYCDETIFFSAKLAEMIYYIFATINFHIKQPTNCLRCQKTKGFYVKKKNCLALHSCFIQLKIEFSLTFLKYSLIYLDFLFENSKSFKKEMSFGVEWGTKLFSDSLPWIFISI